MASHRQLHSRSRPGYTRPGRVRPPITQTAPRGVVSTPAQLQRRLGNRGTQAWLAEQTPVQQIQRKDPPDELSGQKNGEGEELLQGKFDPMQTQGSEEEELLQGKFSDNEAPAQFQGDQGKAENRTGMPDPLKAGLEQLSGTDLSGVRVHQNSTKPAQLNALAYTQGQDIHVAPGQEKHLPHEGWHAVQQMQGRVQPTMQAKGVSINDDASLESEADVMGAKALQMRPASTERRQQDDYQGVTSFRQEAKTRQELKAPGKSLQRQLAPIDEVKKVRSLKIEEDLKPGIVGAENFLKNKVAARLRDIDTDLERLKPYLKQKWANDKHTKLVADRKKSLEEILGTPDSQWVNKNHREQIRKAHKKLEQRKRAHEASQTAFHQYDKRFAGADVIKELKKKRFTAPELKALVSQESGDLSMADTKGDIAGPAQIGTKETREVGHKEADRLDPNKFALVAAKVLIKKAVALEAGSPGLPTVGGKEYKKFVFASYNAGQGTIIEARKKTVTFKRDHRKWDDVIKVAKVPAGYDTSGLHEGIKIKLPKLDTSKKYKETVGYVSRILKRLA